MKKNIIITKDISTLPIITGSVDNINVGDILHYKETFPFIKVRVNNTIIAGDVFISVKTLIDNKYAEVTDNNKKGKFIVFESINNINITKQIELYQHYLINNNIKYVTYNEHFDSNTEYDNASIIEIINNLYKLNDVIADNIDDGYIVLCNSWLYKLLANINNIDLFNSILCLTSSLILPNRIIYLEADTVPNHVNIGLNYEYIISEDSVSYNLIKVIKSNNSIIETHNNIVTILKEFVDK